jgi:serine phosphatase RsbU (regulator of sigma subunit)
MVPFSIPTSDSNLQYAQTIQNGLLPKERHFKKIVRDFFVIYKPQDIIGGDFYWLTKKNDVIYFALSDCTGHGVSGAMLSVLGISLLNYIINKNIQNVGDILSELDKKWIETFQNENDVLFNNDWMEITIVSYNTNNHNFQYASAGGEFALCQNRAIKTYKGNKYPIGGWQIEKNRIFDTFTIDLSSDAVFYFFSDGFKHQFDNKNKKKFSRKKLIDLLFLNHTISMNEQKDFIDHVFAEWKNQISQTDDVSLVGLKF